MTSQNTNTSFEEKRKAPRKNKNVKFRLRPNGPEFDLVGETKNLSGIGALCQVNRAIPEMTYLKVVLELPGAYAECEGTVVRVEKNPTKDGIYNVAIYFDGIAPAEKKKIEDFVGL